MYKIFLISIVHNKQQSLISSTHDQQSLVNILHLAFHHNRSVHLNLFLSIGLLMFHLLHYPYRTIVINLTSQHLCASSHTWIHNVMFNDMVFDCTILHRNVDDTYYSSVVSWIWQSASNSWYSIS